MQSSQQQPNYIEGENKPAILQLLQRQIGPGKTASGGARADMMSMELEQCELLPFIRRLEAIILAPAPVQQQSALIYWSSADATWLLPERANLQSLKKTTLACAVFSEELRDLKKPNEICVAVLSKELSVIVYGFALGQAGGSPGKYHCTLAFDPQLIKHVLKAMSPHWEFIDPIEADKTMSVINCLEPGKTAPRVAASLAQIWNELKKSAETALTEATEGAISSAPPSRNYSPAKSSATSAVPSSAVSAASDESAASAASTSAGSYNLMQRIALAYPYPIANPYRILESLTSPAEKYKEQLRLVENLLAFLAGLSLALGSDEDPALVEALKTNLSSGISVGHWRELIRKCTVVWKKGSLQNIPLAKQILDLHLEQVERGTGKAIEQLVRARNDFAHHRGPTAEAAIEKEVLRIGELLKEAIEATDFLCQHPLRIVKQVDVLPSGLIKLTCLKASGDHPALAKEELHLQRGFPKGQLIINCGDSHWLSVYPFLSQDICPKCGMMEIYLLDKWKFDRNQLFLRSFERGHTIESPTLSDALKARLPGKRM